VARDFYLATCISSDDSRNTGNDMRIALYAWESLHSIHIGGVPVHVTELAAGKPVVLTRNEGPAEIVTYNQEGLVASDNPGSIC
jgi:hypothetical protein